MVSILCPNPRRFLYKEFTALSEVNGLNLMQVIIPGAAAQVRGGFSQGEAVQLTNGVVIRGLIAAEGRLRPLVMHG